MISFIRRIGTSRPPVPTLNTCPGLLPHQHVMGRPHRTLSPLPSPIFFLSYTAWSHLPRQALPLSQAPSDAPLLSQPLPPSLPPPPLLEKGGAAGSTAPSPPPPLAQMEAPPTATPPPSPCCKRGALQPAAPPPRIPAVASPRSSTADPYEAPSHYCPPRRRSPKRSPAVAPPCSSAADTGVQPAPLQARGCLLCSENQRPISGRP
jgi:hypothetical protein